MQEWQRHQQTSYDFVNLHTIEMNDRKKKLFYAVGKFPGTAARKIWLLLLNRFVYRFQSYYFKIVLPCLWHDIDIAEVTSERHIKCDTITIIKFIYFGWVSDKTHYITSLSIFRSTHQFDGDGDAWKCSPFAQAHTLILEHLSFCSVSFIHSVSQSLTHVLYRTSASPAPRRFRRSVDLFSTKNSQRNVTNIGYNWFEIHQRAVVQKDGILVALRVALPCKSSIFTGKNVRIMKMCQIQAPLLARRRTITTI